MIKGKGIFFNTKTNLIPENYSEFIELMSAMNERNYGSPENIHKVIKESIVKLSDLMFKSVKFVSKFFIIYPIIKKDKTQSYIVSSKKMKVNRVDDDKEIVI